MAFTNIDEIRSVEWDQGYLWDIYFTESLNSQHKSRLTQPFDKWFPASTVNDERFSINEENFQLHQNAGFPLPSGAQQRGVTIGFYDNMSNVLTKWLTTWVKTDILNDGKYLTPLSKCTKELHIVKLNSQREPVDIFHYLVIPSGMMDFQGTEHSESTVHNVRFLIVGEEVSKK